MGGQGINQGALVICDAKPGVKYALSQDEKVLTVASPSRLRCHKMWYPARRSVPRRPSGKVPAVLCSHRGRVATLEGGVGRGMGGRGMKQEEGGI